MKKKATVGKTQWSILQKILITMRLTMFLVILGVSQVFAGQGFSQSSNLTLTLKNSAIENILFQIEEQSEYTFLYNKDLIDVKRRIDIDVKDKNIDAILFAIFKGQDVKIHKVNNNIIISPKFISRQDKKTVSGKVTDKYNQPLPGVTVRIKGTAQGTVTDADGNYSLSNVPGDATLVFSFVGMQTQEITIGSQSSINVTMQADVIGIDEVVAIGYGTIKKSDLTGAVSSINADELQETPMTSIDQGLVGRAAGVMVTQTSGMPGAVASIRVRGTSSLQGGNEPLYVIDGFPVYSGSGLGGNGGNAKMSGLATINPADIKSIEILKDASATAIYGARAANGVVLITTKNGKRGSDLITFDATYGVQSVVKKIDVMNALQYAELVNEAYTNDGLAAIYDETKMQQIRQNPNGTDWQDEIFRTAPSQNYQLTFSGGDKKMIYSVTANYYDQEGIIRNSDFKRYSSRINLERNVIKNVRLGTHLSMSQTISNAVITDAGNFTGVVTSAMKFNPISPVFENEALRKYTLMNEPGIPYNNPVGTADETIRKNQTARLLGDIFGELEIIPGLKAKILLGIDVFNTKGDTFIPSYIHDSEGIANATVRGGYTTNWLNENTLSWVRKINPDHEISLLGGITFQQNHYEGLSASSQDFVNDVLKENSLQAGAIYNRPSSSNTDWSLLSYLGRVNYTYKERYLFSFNTRVDGSSRFGKNNKYAFFPSGSFAWRLIEEDFIKEQGVFSNLKLRTSYGLTGNQEIGLFNSLPTLASTTYTFGRSLATGFYPNKIPNPDLRWEKTAQFDVGIDMAFFNNRLRITSDYYYKETTDLIYSVAIPYVSGFSSSLQNIGSVENQGLELAIESDNLNARFKWTTSFNISFNKNKVLELGGEDYKDIGDGDRHLKTGAVHRLITGKPVGLFYGYVFDGIFQDQAELDAGPQSPTNWIGGRRYADLGGPDGVPDGVVDATYDRTVIGDTNPIFFGGLFNTFSYEGFELNVFLQYTYGNDLLNYNAIEMKLPSGGQNVYADLVNRWTPSNPSNKYPKASTNRSAVFSDAYIEDGSYLKVKTLTLAYMFPGLRAKHISNLKLYVTGQNLLTFTNYSGYDPEVSYRGATNLQLGEDFGGYPQAKTIMLGLRMNIK